MWFISTSVVVLFIMIILFGTSFVYLIKRNKNIRDNIGLELKEAHVENYYSSTPHHPGEQLKPYVHEYIIKYPNNINLITIKK